MSARPLIGPRRLAELLGAPDLVVLDATVDLPRPEHDGDHRATSGRAGWQAEHLPGALHLDLLDDFADLTAGYHFAHPDGATATRVLQDLGLHDGSTVVLYDRTDGFWAARAWWSLRALGLHATVLDGGLAAWRRAGGAVVAAADPGPGTRAGTGGEAAARVLTLRPDPGLWATRDDVLATIQGRSDTLLVCALGAEQFTGTALTRYSRRGHIPTSRNLPARDLAGQDGTFDVAHLRELARGLRGKDVLLYCGGGISASYAALGLVVAGHERVRIYDGSLEEWSADPSLPLVV